MMTCEDATLMMTRSEYEKLSYMNNIRLRMHIMLCKPCQSFNKQNKLITEKYNELLASENGHVLSDAKRKELRDLVKEKMAGE